MKPPLTRDDVAADDGCLFGLGEMRERGDLLTVASVIPEQSNLKKLWTNIKDLCFH
ncbi:hypothetical protein WN943_023135 [Citrus x changshan-huyou]